ncbi:VOC family protein [Williamsia sp.]|uniref:VOC family protein n=1 Tax=Williamsia sp. TaxID=1872085 RepID=UPI001A34FDD3|nr:VOC family protein [Williamsia sp.]MBJ7288455.1 VOC family protein [Williamsia sp.]
MTEIRTYPPGVTSWVDAEYGDVDAALEFYRELFGWQYVEATPPGLPYRYVIARLDGADVGGIGGPATVDTTGSIISTWNTYIAVADAAASVEQVVRAGGSVVHPPQGAGDGGISATVHDPQGVTVRLWQARDRAGAQVTNVPGAWNFSDLHTSDPVAATAFYSDVFGWRTTDLGFATMITVPGYGEHLASTVDPDIHRRQQSAPPGFADSIGWLAQTDEGEIPHWHVTFAVADRDATTATAQRLGAAVVSTATDDWTHTAVIRDPQGAVFTASQFTPPDAW